MKIYAGKKFAAVRAGNFSLGQIVNNPAAIGTCLVNGIAMDDWQSYRPQDSDLVILQPRAGEPFSMSALFAALLSTALSIAASFIARALAPKPKSSDTRKPESRFGVAGLDNTIEQGTPIITHYGTTRTFPHVIGSYTRIAGKSGRGGMEFGVLGLVGYTGGDGYEFIGNPQINDKDISLYPGATFEVRYGTIPQAVIKDFDNVEQVFFDGREIPHLVELQSITITGTPTSGTYTLTVPTFGSTTALAFNATSATVQTALRAISGLGSIVVTSTGTSPNFTHMVSFDGTTGNIGTMTKTETLAPARARVTIAVLHNGTSASASPITYSTKGQVDQIAAIFQSNGLATLEGDGATHKIKVERKKTSEGAGAWVEVTDQVDDAGNVTAAVNSPIKWSDQSYALLHKEFRIRFTTRDFWDIRFSLASSSSKTGRPLLFNVQETQFTTLSYDGYALACIRGLASNQVQSLQSMKWSFEVKGKKVAKWNGTAWTAPVWTDERAWCINDFLTHPKVGVGHRFKQAYFDHAAALIEQNYLNALVPGFGGVNETRDRFDWFPTDRKPAISYLTEDLLGEIGAGFIPSGNKLKLFVDKARTPNLLWAYPGNIIEDEGGPVKVSFSYGGQGSVNTIRGTYPDVARNYATQTKEISIGSPTEIRETSIQLDSIRRESQAIRALTYHLKRQQIKERRSWRAAGDAQVSEPWDLDYLSYDTVRNIRGYQGTVSGGSTTSIVQLPRLVTLGAFITDANGDFITDANGDFITYSSQIYDILIRHSKDNVVEKRTISTPVGIWGSVSVTTPFATAPVDGDLWAIGEANVAFLEMVLDNVKLEEDGNYRLTAHRYDATLYDPPALGVAEVDNPVRSTNALPIPLLAVAATQQLIANQDGSFSASIIFDVTPGLHLIAGIAQSGGATTIRLAANSPPLDDYFNTARVTITAGLGVGQSAIISDYNGTTKDATVPAWTTAPNSTSQYQIEFFIYGPYKGFRVEMAPEASQDFAPVGSTDGTHLEVANVVQGVTRVYRFTPISTYGVENFNARWTKTITTQADTVAPSAPDSVVLTSQLKAVTVTITEISPTAHDLAGFEIEFWKDAPVTGTLLKPPLQIPVTQEEVKTGNLVRTHTDQFPDETYGDVITARVRSYDYSKNFSGYTTATTPVTLSEIAPEDAGGMIPSNVYMFQSIDPANIASQILLEITAFDSGTSVFIGGGLVPPVDLEADIIPLTQSLVDTGSITRIGIHSVGAVNGASKLWRRVCIPEIGLRHSFTWDPANNIPGQSTGSQFHFPSSIVPGNNDLILPFWDPNFEANLALPFGIYANSNGGGSLYMVLHTHFNLPTLANRTHQAYIIRNPERYFQVITVSVDPPSIAFDTAVKIDVTIPAGIAELGDFIAMIPPFNLDTGIFPIGAYLSSTTNIKLGLHNVHVGSAVNDTAKDWKFVVIPGDRLLI